MKTKITTDSNGTISITYADAFSGERLTRCFFCPSYGGYVRECLPDYPQVCEGLGSSGSTLLSPSREALADLIRREFRAMRRYERRAESV